LIHCAAFTNSKPKIDVVEKINSFLGVQAKKEERTGLIIKFFKWFHNQIYS
jgi:hypothetical protein